MSELLSDVLRIEENARKLTEEAKKKKEELQADLSQSAEKLHDEIIDRAHAKMEQVRANETAAAEQRLAASEEHKKAQLEKISQFEKANFDRLVKDVTDCILK